MDMKRPWAVSPPTMAHRLADAHDNEVRSPALGWIGAGALSSCPPTGLIRVCRPDGALPDKLVRDMGDDGPLTELRRGVLGPCVLALLEQRPRFGLELVRDLAAAGGLLRSDGTVYPLLNRLRDAGLVDSAWRDDMGARPRRYYSITGEGRESLEAFRTRYATFTATVDAVLNPRPSGRRRPAGRGPR